MELFFENLFPLKPIEDPWLSEGSLSFPSYKLSWLQVQMIIGGTVIIKTVYCNLHWRRDQLNDQEGHQCWNQLLSLAIGSVEHLGKEDGSNVKQTAPNPW
jgi:hypothetical protein